ncbi:hypothetical protein M9458_001927, partial [Cirrhinus mrigala]
RAVTASRWMFAVCVQGMGAHVSCSAGHSFFLCSLLATTRSWTSPLELNESKYRKHRRPETT